MRTVSLKLLLLVIGIPFTLTVDAQQCSGSFGAPVFYQTFGAGTGPGQPLTDTTKALLYTSANSPGDGFYSITNSIFGSGNRFPNTWKDIYRDHTSNRNGYMMAINAGNTPGEIYRQYLGNLKKGTVYEFSFYILNLVKKSLQDSTIIDPQIKYTISTITGEVLASDSTGKVPRTEGAFWYRFTLNFTAPDDATQVLLTMEDTAPGGNGNDFILDDIGLQICREKINIPNTFTPNADGVNDTWVINQLVNYPESMIKIYDKFGQQLFQSSGYVKAWDGRYRGALLPAGVYYYTIDLHNDTAPLSGWVLLVH